MKHLINQLTFEIYCPSEDDALGLRHNFAQTLQLQMEAGIDTICSKYTHQTEAVRIDRLEVDLGQFNPHTFDRRIMEVFLEKFECALLKKLAETPFSEREDANTYSHFEALIHFLETGQRIWWKSNEQTDFNQWFIKYLDEDQSLVFHFLKNSMSNDRIWRRIALQFNARVHEKLVHKVTDLKLAANWMLRHLAEVSKVSGYRPQSQLQQLINKLVIANFVQLSEGDTISNKSLELLASHIQNSDKGVTSNEKVIFDRIETLLVQGPHEIYNDPSQLAKPETKVEQRDREKYLSGHGGAVIVSQFLKPLFKNLGLYEDGEWKDNHSRFKAVLLINYLCTDDDTTPEYNLNIEKLLCGLPLNAPIPFEADLTKAEKQEASLLLESIIEHWGVLKNTSIDGLRETFLLRDCIISNDGTHWHITIERKTVDVLLDKLPWGFSVIMLPWNDYQIYVTW